MTDAAAPRDADLLPFWLKPAGLVLIVLLLTVLRIWTAGHAWLVEDEAYYRLWGLHPAFGYYDHPPMVAWWIWLGEHIIGDTSLGVRLVGILAGALGSLVLWRTACLLLGRRAAGWSVLFFNATVLIGVGGILITPDAPSVFFWGLSLWALAELQASGKANWWLAIGLFAGLGLVSKYSVFFLGAGIVLWLLWVPDARRWLKSWQLWVGGLIAILCFLPVVQWNADHEWISFVKQFGRADRGAFTTKYIFEFIGGLLGMLNPLVAVLAIGGAVHLGRKTLKQEAPASLLILLVLPFLVYLLIHSLHARVQANWPAPLFPAFAMLAAACVTTCNWRPGFWRRWSVVGVILGLVVSVVVQIHAVDPLTGHFGRKDPTFQLRGWPEVRDQLAEVIKKEDAAYLATMSYGMTGQMAFAYRSQNLPVIQLDERLRYAMMPTPSAELFSKPGLYVATNRRDRSAMLKAVYANVQRVATIPRQVAGKRLEDIVVYRVSDPKSSPLSAF